MVDDRDTQRVATDDPYRAMRTRMPPPLLLLDPGAVEADEIACESWLPTWFAKDTGSFPLSRLPTYQDVAAAVAPAAASTLAKRLAHTFWTSRATA
jgi:hypothetical protein